MTGRQTNLALLALLPLGVLTGFVAFTLGTPRTAAAVVVVHGVIGLAVVLLSPWKSVAVRRGMRRRRGGRWVSLALTTLVVVVVATGIGHAAGWRGVVPGVTTMQLHVGAALATLPLVGWHALRRPVPPRRVDGSRRAFGRTAAVGAAAGVAWMAAETTWAVAGTRGAHRRFTGSHETGSFVPAVMPVTQWLFDTVPQIDPVSWRLDVSRSDGNQVLRIGDLGAEDTVRAVIDCTGGWWATQDWSGVRLDRLVGPPGSARSVVVTSATGYRRRFSVADLSSLWLATACDREPLSAGHGAPARLVVPGRRGFWWVKWVVAIELDDAPAWRQPPLPLQ